MYRINRLKRILIPSILLIGSTIFAQDGFVSMYSGNRLEKAKVNYIKFKDNKCKDLLYDKKNNKYYEPFKLENKYKKSGVVFSIKYRKGKKVIPKCYYASPILIVEIDY